MNLGAQRRSQETVQQLEKSGIANNGAVPLAANTSYTSPKIDCEHWGWLIGTCYADKDGELKAQFSEDDGENWDGEHAVIAYTAEDKKIFAFEVLGNAGRLVFTNGAQDQTKFRLFMQLKRTI